MAQKEGSDGTWGFDIISWVIRALRAIRLLTPKGLSQLPHPIVHDVHQDFMAMSGEICARTSSSFSHVENVPGVDLDIWTVALLRESKTSQKQETLTEPQWFLALKLVTPLFRLPKQPRCRMYEMSFCSSSETCLHFCVFFPTKRVCLHMQKGRNWTSGWRWQHSPGTLLNWQENCQAVG